jgi:hypothetical protein
LDSAKQRAVAQGWRASQAVSGGLAGPSTIEADEAIRWQHLSQAEGENSIAKMKYRSRRPSEAITLLNELAAAGAEREETNSASAHAPRCRHSAARNATACLTSTSNNAFTGFRRAMDHTMDWMCCSCDR